jgi:hypothetical protein
MYVLAVGWDSELCLSFIRISRRVRADLFDVDKPIMLEH